jgi:multiple sugar transport system substrate-binding protein
MKKSILALSIMLLIGMFLPAVLFASGAADSELTIPEGIDLVTTERIGNPNAEITITWWPQQSYGPFSDIATRIEYLREKLEAWSYEHPNVKIEPSPWGGSATEFYAKLAIDASSGRGPDAVQMPDLPVYNKWLAPLNDYISQSELNDFFPWTHNIMVDPDDGKIKRIKFNTGSTGLMYRRDIIDEPPRTWDEVFDLGKQLQSEGFEHGFWSITRQAATLYTLVFPMFSSYLNQTGGVWYDENERPTFGDIPAERAKMIEIYSVYKRLIDEGLMPIEIIEGQAVMDSAAVLASGDTPMYMGLVWGSQLEQVGGAGLADQWALTHSPQLSADDPQSAPAGGWNYGFFADSKETLDPAFDLVWDLYASEEGMAGWCEAGGYPPVRASVYEKYPAFSARSFQELAAVLSTAQPWPPSPTFEIMRDESRDAMEAMLLGRLTPEEAVDTFWQGTLEQLD